MKTSITIGMLLGSSAVGAFAPGTMTTPAGALQSSYKATDLPGIVAPLGFFDPFGFAERADNNTLKRYREAEITHGRVAMLATLGFLVGEQVTGSTPLFNGSIEGPAISHLNQCPQFFWVALLFCVSFIEFVRAQVGFVEPWNVPMDQPGYLRASYDPGDLGFDPLGLKPSDPFELKVMQTKELQNGRLAMIAAAGFMAQEAVNGKGIVENLKTYF